MSAARPPVRGAGPYRVGVVSHRLGSDSYEREILAGIVAAVGARGASVLCFGVKGMESFGELVGSDMVDAWVLLSGPLIHALGSAALEAFCARRRNLPIASIGAPLAGSAATIRADSAKEIGRAHV